MPKEAYTYVISLVFLLKGPVELIRTNKSFHTEGYIIQFYLLP
jgi:hypothetical protein